MVAGLRMTRPGVGVWSALAAMLIWGLVPVGTRFFVLSIDPVQFTLIRYGTAGLAALPLAWRAKVWRWPRVDLLRLALSSACAIPGYNLSAAFAARTVSAGGMGLLIALEPLFILLFSLLLQRSAPQRPVLAGALVAFAGTALTVLGGGGGPGAIDPAGAALAVFGVATWALYAVVSAPLAERYGGSGVTGAVLVVGGSMLAAVAAPTLGDKPWPAPAPFAEVALMGLASGLVGFVFWNQAAARLSPAQLGLWLYLIPLFSLVGGLVLLDERLTLAAIGGGALILAGVAIGEGRLAWRRAQP